MSKLADKGEEKSEKICRLPFKLSSILLSIVACFGFFQQCFLVLLLVTFQCWICKTISFSSHEHNDHNYETLTRLRNVWWHRKFVQLKRAAMGGSVRLKEEENSFCTTIVAWKFISKNSRQLICKPNKSASTATNWTQFTGIWEQQNQMYSGKFRKTSLATLLMMNAWMNLVREVMRRHIIECRFR